MKTTQTTLQDRFEWMTALDFLLTSKIITLHDYWLLIGYYRIEGGVKDGC